MTGKVAVIPAKGTSRRISRKNMVPFGRNGDRVPLVQYTINAALNSNVDEIYVVTDDHEINSLARKLGAKTVLSPQWLSSDGIQAEMAIYYALFEINPKPTTLICLQPTSPLRLSGDINNAIDLYIELNRSYRKFFEQPYSVFSAFELERFAYTLNGVIAVPLNHDPLFRVGHEEADDSGVVIENGAIYISAAKLVKKYKTFRAGRLVPYYMDVYDSIEIDTELDLAIAEVINEKKN